MLTSGQAVPTWAIVWSDGSSVDVRAVPKQVFSTRAPVHMFLNMLVLTRGSVTLMQATANINKHTGESTDMAAGAAKIAETQLWGCHGWSKIFEGQAVKLQWPRTKFASPDPHATFWMSGNLTDSCRRATQPSRSVSFNPLWSQ